jgi:hypothetical protein
MRLQQYYPIFPAESNRETKLPHQETDAVVGHTHSNIHTWSVQSSKTAMVKILVILVDVQHTGQFRTR